MEPGLTNSKTTNFLQLAKEAVCILNPQQQIVFSNKAFQKLYTIPGDKSSETEFASLIVEGEIEKFNALFSRLLEDANSTEEAEFKCKTTRSQIELKGTQVNWGNEKAVLLYVNIEEGRHKNSGKIEQLEEETRKLFDASRDLFLIFKPDGTVIRANKAMAKRMNESVKELEGTNCLEWFDPETTKRRHAQLNKMLKTGKEQVFVDERDGYFSESHIFPISMGENKEKLVALVVRDITNQKRFENKIKESEDRFSKAFYNLATPSTILNLKTGERLAINLKFIELLGYSEKELLESNVFTSNIAVDQKEFKATLAKTLVEGSLHEHPFKMRTKNGEKIDLIVNATKLSDENDAVFIISYVDVSATLLAQNQLKLSELKFSKAFHNQTVAKQIFDLDSGKRIEVNEEFCRLTGYSQKELLESSLEEIGIWTDSEKKKESIYKLKTDRELFNFPIEMKSKDGKIKKLLANASVFEAGNSNLVIASFNDITLLSKAYEDIKQAKERAENSDKLKSAFLTNMSHEIRTPLNGIVGFVELFDNPDLDAEQRKRYMSIIKKSSERLTSTVTDIIELSVIQSDTISSSKGEVNVVDLFNKLQKKYSKDLETSHIKLEFPKFEKEKSIRLITDGSKLETILSHLLNNALKFTQKGYVKTEYKFDSGEHIFSVSDSGRGIPHEKQELIFESFVQADPEINRGHEGLGIGLTIAKAYAILLGGSISVDSETGKGSKFVLRIRAEQKQDIPNCKTTEPEESEMIKTILIAEDTFDSLQLLRTIIIREFPDLKILGVENGEKAVEAFEKDSTIGLILMDIKMPVMDGLEATKKIREKNKSVPIIAQTAYALAGDSKLALEAGCTDYIAKPFTKSNLLRKLKTYMST